MPVYEFQCDQCHTRFEARLPFSRADESVTCPKGHRETRRLFSAPGILFKGSGFYVTDNRKNGAQKDD